METTEIVKVKQKYQIVLPVGLRKRISCKIGDLAENAIKYLHKDIHKGGQ